MGEHQGSDQRGGHLQLRLCNMFIFLFFPLVSGQNYPGALCNVTYSVPVSCNEVTSKIVAQIDLWNEEKSCPGRCDERNSLSPQRGPPLERVLLEGTGEECTKCPCGQQCLYVARGVEDNVILASHITPVIRYKDDLFFRLTERENGSCDVFGHSHSTGPAYYDFTTNYCNLRNLMTGSGLSDLDGYRSLYCRTSLLIAASSSSTPKMSEIEPKEVA